MDELPDLDNLRLGDLSVSIECEAPVDRADAEDQLVGWRCELRSRDFETEMSAVMATAELWTFSSVEASPVVALEAMSADMARFVDFFVDDELDPDLELAGFSGGVVVADRVQVPEPLRGRGLGPLLLAEALTIVGDGFDVALCDPVPFEIESDQPEWILEQARLHRLWSAFGFTEWRGGLWFLDLATITLETTRQQLSD